METDQLKEIENLQLGMPTPDWYNSDIAIKELVRRVLALEEKVKQLESKEQ